MTRPRIQPGDDLFGELEPPTPNLSRPIADEHDELQPLTNNAAKSFERGIRAITVSILMVTWAVAGLVLWLPMLTSAVLGFVISVTGVTMSSKNAAGAGDALNRAVPFYFQGFRNYYEAVYVNSASGSQPVRHRMNRRRITFHVIRTAVFWGIVIAIIIWKLN